MAKVIGVIVFLLISVVAIYAQEARADGTAGAVQQVAVPGRKPGEVDQNGQSVPDFTIGGNYYDYVGCFQDNGTTQFITMDGSVSGNTNPGNTPQLCAYWCQQNAPNHTLVAVQLDKCWCGNEHGQSVRVNDCNVTCNNTDNPVPCGGYHAIQVYKRLLDAPVITDQGPQACVPAAQLTIYGAGFGSQPWSISVNNFNLAILYWSDNMISIALPTWVASGHVLTVTTHYGAVITWVLNCVTDLPPIVYPPVITCGSWGDPHIHTYNGLAYEFQQSGEFIMTKVGDLEVQTRQVPCYGTINCNAAVAIKYGSHVFGVYGFSNNAVNVYYNNAPITAPFSAGANVSLTMWYNEFHFAFNDLKVEVRPWGYFDVTVRITTNTTASVYPITGGFCFGLLVNWVGRNETRSMVSSQSEVDAISTSWRVTSSESLFDYTLTIEDYGDFNNVRRERSIDTRAPHITEQEAMHICDIVLNSECAQLIPVSQYFTSCVADVSASGDPALAQTALVAFSSRCITEHPLAAETLVFPTIAANSVARDAADTQNPLYSQSGAGTVNPMYEGLSVPTSGSVTVRVTAVDAVGVRRQTTDDLFIFSCGSDMDACNNVMSANIDAGEYRIEFTTPAQAGTYRFSIRLNGNLLREDDVTVYDPQAIPVLTTVTPADTIHVGDTVTIIGTDLENCNGSVSINGVELVVIEWTTTHIIVVLPSDVVGHITIVVSNCAGLDTIDVLIRPCIVPAHNETCHCSSWGDPHLTTFTNVYYDFQGEGEYWFTKASGFDVQVRQTNCGRGAGVSCNTAAAVNVDGHTVGFYSHQGVDTVYVDGVLINGPWPYTIPGGVGSIDAQIYSTYTLRAWGAAVTVHNLGSFIGVVVDIEPSLRPITGGLCNVLSTNWQYGAPTHALQGITSFNEFGMSWQLTEDKKRSIGDSLFDYTVDGTSFAQRNPGNPILPYTPPIVSPALRDTARQQCQHLLDISNCTGENVNAGQFYAACVMDIMSTGSLAAYQYSYPLWQRYCYPVEVEPWLTTPPPITTDTPTESSTTNTPTGTDTPTSTSAGCVIPHPQDMHTSVAPYIGASVNPDVFKLVVYLNKVHTRVVESITFTHHSVTDYDYRGDSHASWTIDDVAERCLDKFTVLVPMGDLEDVHIAHVAGSYHFAGSLWVNTNETLADGTPRYSTYELRFDFTFPVATTSSIAIEIIANIEVSVVTKKVILQQAQEDRTIDVTVEVGVMYPYELNWVHDINDLSDDGAPSFPEILSPNIEYIDGNNVAVASHPLAEQCSNAPSTACKQRFKFTITPHDSTCNADGRYVLSLAADRCIDDDACLANDGTHKEYKGVTITATLELGSLCAEEHDFAASLSALNVHSDELRTTTPAAFHIWGDPHENVYFSTSATSTGDCSVSAVELIAAAATCQGGNCVVGTTTNQFGNVVAESASSPNDLLFHIPTASLTFAPLSASSVIVRIQAVIYFDCTDGKRSLRYVSAELPSVAAEAQATLKFTEAVDTKPHDALLSTSAVAGIVVGGAVGAAAIAAVATVVIKSIIAANAATRYVPVMDIL